jgi:hypothetical protein
LSEFREIGPNTTGIYLVFSDESLPFDYQVNQGTRQVGNAGSSVVIPVGQSANFIAQGITISFAPVGGDVPAWIVTKKCDLRASGGGIKRECFKVNVSSGFIVFEEKH